MTVVHILCLCRHRICVHTDETNTQNQQLKGKTNQMLADHSQSFLFDNFCQNRRSWLGLPIFIHWAQTKRQLVLIKYITLIIICKQDCVTGISYLEVSVWQYQGGRTLSWQPHFPKTVFTGIEEILHQTRNTINNSNNYRAHNSTEHVLRPNILLFLNDHKTLNPAGLPSCMLN